LEPAIATFRLVGRLRRARRQQCRGPGQGRLVAGVLGKALGTPEAPLEESDEAVTQGATGLLAAPRLAIAAHSRRQAVGLARCPYQEVEEKKRHQKHDDREVE